MASGAARAPAGDNAVAPSDLVRSAHVATCCSLCSVVGQNLVVTAAENSVVLNVFSLKSPGGKLGFECATVTPSRFTVEGTVRCVAVDPQWGRVAVGGDGKTVRIITVKPCGEFNENGIRPYTATTDEALVLGPFNKRVVSLAFDQIGTTLYAGDKFGEVYRITFDEGTGKPTLHSDKPVLSHMGMVTAITVGAGNLVTCDRDGAIRASRLSLPDDIRGFLWLPHTTAENLLGKSNGAVPDSVVVKTSWLHSTLVTGALDGIVTTWANLKREDIDGDATVAGVLRPHRAPVTAVLGGEACGATEFLATFENMQEGALLNVYEPTEFTPVELPAPAVAGDGSAFVTKSGEVFGVHIVEGKVYFGRLANALGINLDNINVAELWHTREAKTAAQLTSGAAADPDPKKGPMAEDRS